MRVLVASDPQLAEPHPQLDDVHRVIQDGSCAVLSLDIFDTLLWRRVPRATDVFGLLGAKLRDAGLAPEWLTDASLREMRIAAERTARSEHGSLGNEVSLFDIWQAMPLAMFSGAGLEELVAAEVDVERALTVVDLDVANVLRAALKYEVPVILVSDTYFTESHLKQLLDRPELGSLADVRIFRSSQHGVDKAGGLWEVVLREIGRSPEQVVHIGDNPVADHEVPAGMGIRTVQYRRIDPGLTELLEREHEPMEYFGPLGPLLDPREGDFGLTSLRAKTLNAGSADGRSTLDTAWRFGAAVLGPVFTGFAEWVARRAHESGISTLWCPMREGELLSAMVNAVAAARGWELRARPIWLSRQATSLGTLDSVEPAAVHEFIRRRYHMTVRQLLDMLRLHPGDVPSLAQYADTLLDSPQIVDKVSFALTETPHLRNLLSVAVNAARERLLISLREAGALDAPELALVDLGWRGTIQLQLAKVLSTAEVAVRPVGFYLATDEAISRLYQVGLRAEGYLGQAGDPDAIVHTLTRSPEVLEQCVSALCGSLIDFTDDGRPILAEDEHSTTQRAERGAVQRGVTAFQRQWLRYVEVEGSGWPELTGPTARARLANVLTSALRVPTPDEASMFGNWLHEDNFGSDVVTKLIPADLVPAIPYLSPAGLADLGPRDTFWPALLAASDTHLGAAAKAIAAGTVEPSVFEASGEAHHTFMRMETSKQKWFDGPRSRVRSNHNGLSFVRLNTEATWEMPDIANVSLAIPGRPAVVRIDWIEAKLVAGGDPERKVLRWEKPAHFADLPYYDCRWLGANLVEFDHDYSSLWLPLAELAGAPITWAQVSIAFAVLPEFGPPLGERLAELETEIVRSRQEADELRAELAEARKSSSPMSRISDRVRSEYRDKGASGVVLGAARLAARGIAKK
ncbi:MAG TPA: HAD family hydrolase [Pseudonocardiaceae bacterium]